MATNSAQVSSAALRGLQSNLKKLSSSIQDICNNLNSDRTRIGQEWRDQKFEEFSNGFQPQIVRCQGIAEHYETWATSVLDRAAIDVEEIEKTNVSGSGSSSAMGSAGVGTGFANSAAGVAGSTAASQIGKNFNTGGSKATTSNASGQTSNAAQSPTRKQVSRSNKKETSWLDKIFGKEASEKKKKITIPKANKKSIEDPCPSGKHAEVSSFTVKTGASKTDPTYDAGGSLSVGASLGAESGLTGVGLKGGVNGSIGGSVTRHSTENTQTSGVDYNYVCVPDDNE